jgi:hypothetical protein
VLAALIFKLTPRASRPLCPREAAGILYNHGRAAPSSEMAAGFRLREGTLEAARIARTSP